MHRKVGKFTAVLPPRVPGDAIRPFKEFRMKNSPQSKRLLGYLCALVLIAAAVALISRLRPEPPPADARYHEGAMRNKAGTAYVTADGRIVPPPPGSRPLVKQEREGMVKE
jgi:hypothetical protein